LRLEPQDESKINCSFAKKSVHDGVLNADHGGVGTETGRQHLAAGNTLRGRWPVCSSAREFARQATETAGPAIASEVLRRESVGGSK
jgi:hypothetical protein